MLKRKRWLPGEKILVGQAKQRRKSNRSYPIIKKENQDLWREKIFNRDKRSCRVCNSNSSLQLCHITSVTTLRWQGYSIEESYREDNLVTMCYVCHKIQHNHQKGLLITQFAKDRAKKIKELLDRIKAERGWTAAWQLRYLKENRVLSTLKLST